MTQFLEGIPQHITRTTTDPTILPIAKKCNYSEEFTLKLQKSIGVIEQAIMQYGIQQIALSFNGGKDCTLLLYLLDTTLKRIYASNLSILKTKIKTLYVMVSDPFIEIEEFVDECCKRYLLI